MDKIKTDFASLERLPANLIKTQLMATVPAHQYTDPLWALAKQQPAKSSFRRLIGSSDKAKNNPSTDPTLLALDVSLWVRCSTAPEKPLGLLIKYQDQTGSHAVLVDEEDTRGGLSALLSGRVELPFVGWVEELSLHCSGMMKKHALHAESWHVKKLEESASDIAWG